MQANILLQHICKAGNGHVPKPVQSDSHTSQNSKKGKVKYKPLTSSSAANPTPPYHFNLLMTGSNHEAVVTHDDTALVTSSSPFGGKVAASSTSTGAVQPSSEEKLARCGGNGMVWLVLYGYSFTLSNIMKSLYEYRLYLLYQIKTKVFSYRFTGCLTKE